MCGAIWLFNAYAFDGDACGVEWALGIAFVTLTSLCLDFRSAVELRPVELFL